jgi:predicted RNA-binding protein YlqC (UPF0109 family)
MEEGATMKEIVEHITKALVDYPEEIEVTEEEDEDNLVINLRVAQDDLGKIIGRQGRLIQAIRTIVYAAAKNQERNINLRLEE